MAAAAMTATAGDGFTALGGTAAGCTFSLENSVSGSVKGVDGTVVSVGTTPLASVAVAGIVDVAVEPANEAETAVYTVDGSRISADVESLQPGVYVVREGTRSYKFIKPKH